MKIKASPAGRARIGPKPWRNKIAVSVRVAPLGLGCAVLLYLMGLEIDRGFDSFNQLRSSPEPLLTAQIDALAAVHSSMVELPSEGDARAIAHLTTSARMVWLQNGQLASVVRKLETQYAGLVRRYEADLAQQRDNLANTQIELRRLQDQQDPIVAQVGTTMAVERDLTAGHNKPERPGHDLAPEASEAGHAVDEQIGLAAAIRNNLAIKTAAPRSWISNTGLLSEPSARFAALQIARRLDKTRREALRSKLQRIFAVDAQTRVLREVAGSKLLQLDPALELRFITASSEAIGERSGRIRFFPDGTSTGGRIQVRHDRERATVTVDRSTGNVTVTVNGD